MVHVDCDENNRSEYKDTPHDIPSYHKVDKGFGLQKERGVVLNVIFNLLMTVVVGVMIVIVMW